MPISNLFTLLSIKREWLNRFKIRNYEQAYRLVFEYLEAFYNTKRIHSCCDYISPVDFEKLYERTSWGGNFGKRTVQILIFTCTKSCQSTNNSWWYLCVVVPRCFLLWYNRRIRTRCFSHLFREKMTENERNGTKKAHSMKYGMGFFWCNIRCSPHFFRFLENHERIRALRFIVYRRSPKQNPDAVILFFRDNQHANRPVWWDLGSQTIFMKLSSLWWKIPRHGSKPCITRFLAIAPRRIA